MIYSVTDQTNFYRMVEEAAEQGKVLMKKAGTLAFARRQAAQRYIDLHIPAESRHTAVIIGLVGVWKTDCHPAQKGWWRVTRRPMRAVALDEPTVTDVQVLNDTLLLLSAHASQMEALLQEIERITMNGVMPDGVARNEIVRVMQTTATGKAPSIVITPKTAGAVIRPGTP